MTALPINVREAAVHPAMGVTSKEIGLSGDSIPVGEVGAGPMLLLPLRIETRFMDSAADPNKPELWLRIFPDQIAIDSHDASLTEDEWTAAQQYWGQMAKCGSQDTACQQASWAQLAATFGPRRAAYVTAATQPAGFDAWLARKASAAEEKGPISSAVDQQTRLAHQTNKRTATVLLVAGASGPGAPRPVVCRALRWFRLAAALCPSYAAQERPCRRADAVAVVRYRDPVLQRSDKRHELASRF
jgi:hypothetical protein